MSRKKIKITKKSKVLLVQTKHQKTEFNTVIDAFNELSMNLNKLADASMIVIEAFIELTKAYTDMMNDD